MGEGEKLWRQWYQEKPIRLIGLFDNNILGIAANGGGRLKHNTVNIVNIVNIVHWLVNIFNSLVLDIFHRLGDNSLEVLDDWLHEMLDGLDWLDIGLDGFDWLNEMLNGLDWLDKGLNGLDWLNERLNLMLDMMNGLWGDVLGAIVCGT